MDDKFNTWGKLWTYLLVLLPSLIALGAGWAINVYSHWQPAVRQNKRIGLEANEGNLHKFARIRRFADSINSPWADSIKYEARGWQIRTVAEAKAADTTPKAPNIIDSVFVANINTTWMSVMVRSQVKCQAVARYGPLSGIYTGSGVKEESFNYSNHSLRIGNAEPLEPGTKYYIQVEATDQNGNVYFSKEITGETLEN